MNPKNSINIERNLFTSRNIISDVGWRISRTKSRTCKFAIGITLSTGISMIVGILVVCFTTPKPSGETCAVKIKSIHQNLADNDSDPKYIAVYDFNNDSKLDIAVVNSGTNNIGIFLGNDNGTFASQVTYPTGTDSNPVSIAIGDFNNDGQMDIVVANFGSNNIGILLGNHDGTFKQQTTFSVGSSHPLQIAVGDFNNDSRLDIVIVNYGTNIIGLLLGYGNGNFSSQIELSAAYDSLPFSVVAGDFNNDKKLDIVVANYGTHNIAVFLGNANGTFPIQKLFSIGIGSHPYAIAVADFNHDNNLDIVVANYGADNVCVLFGHGNGTFAIQATYSTGMSSKPMSIIVSDFNLDHHLDIAVCNNGANNVGVFLGFGNGSFGNQVTFLTGASTEPYSIVGGDFNGDDRLDIAVVNYGTNNVGILLAYANATFSSQTIYSTDSESQPISVAVGDFNNDTQLDIVVANNGGNSNGIFVENGGNNIGIFIGNGAGGFSNQTTHPTGDYTSPFAVAVGDFNNDSLLDIAVAYVDYSGGYIGILLGKGGGVFSNPIKHTINSYNTPSSIAAHDFNNDKRLDIVILCAGDYFILVLLGDGDGNFPNSLSSTLNSGGNEFAVADFNSDDKLDIAVAYNLSSYSQYSAVGVLLGCGNGTFTAEVTFSTGYYALTQGVAVGDFNDDGRLDIVVANYWNNNVGILLGYGNGTFSGQKIYSTGAVSHPNLVAVGDFNNDTQADILFNSAVAMGVGILLGYGDGSFANPVIYPTSTQSAPVAVAIGDFNDDSLLDITVVNLNDNNIGVLLGFANANFMLGITLSTGSSSGPRCVIAGDFNEDGQMDFATANYITNNVGVFRGDGTGNFPIQMTYSTGSISSPTFVIVDDFNNDAHQDIAVSNSGTDSLGIFLGYGNGSFGTQFLCSLADGSNPQSIASGDFNKDNVSDVVVASYGKDSINVFLNYDDGSFATAIPYSTGEGSSPHALAVGDFNNDHRVDIVVVNNLNHNFGIFYGNGDGSFSSQKIYPLGDQCLPVAVAVGDFNRDSLLDLIVVDNANYKVYVFLGHGDGNFSASTNYSTGSGSWPGSIAVGDLNNDNRLDIVVGNFQTNTVGIFLGNGDGSFSQQTIYQTIGDAGLSSVALGDFNNDSCLDIAICNAHYNNVGILFGNCSGTFSYQTISESSNGTQPAWVTIADFDNDGRLDIVVANEGLDNLVVYFGNGNGSFSDQVALLTGTGSQPLFVAVGDFNNDGTTDIVTANSQLDNVGVFLGYVNRIFFSQTTYYTGYNTLTTVVVVADFNNDSRLDIAACNQGNDNIVIFLGYADNSLLSLPPYSTGLSSQPTYVATGDFNNDTQLDVAVANYGTDNVMILLGSGYGTFYSETTYSTGDGSQPRWIAIGDLNKDNRFDIVIANSGNDNVGVYLGNGNGTFSSQLTYSTGLKSQPLSVIIGDFNNDTLQDIAIANYGSNNVGVFLGYGNGSFGSQNIFSTGFNSRPYALTSGDVNNDNVSDIIIANNGFGDIVIIMKLC